MRSRFIIVVGDKFKEFAAGKDAVTMSQLRGLLAVPHLINHGGDRLVMVPAQGLSEEDITEILSLAHTAHGHESYDFSLWDSHPRRASSSHSHKRQRHNTVISEPRRTGEDSFVLDMLVDQECELMGDHQTGQHVQGMILMEAARQSFLAVTEAFYLPKDGTSRYFVIDEMTIRYKKFVFPVGAQLTYTVREKDLSGSRQRFLVDVAVIQGNAEAASTTIGFTVFDAARIAKREGQLAVEALEMETAALAARLDSEIAEAA